jgi:hypothetical protein
MPVPTVRPPIVTDYDDQNQRQTRTAIKALDQPGNRKVIVKGVALSGTTVRVPHQLGRLPTAWQVIDKTAQADVWRDTASPVSSDSIPLKASAAVTVDLIFW